MLFCHAEKLKVVKEGMEKSAALQLEQLTLLESTAQQQELAGKKCCSNSSILLPHPKLSPLHGAYCMVLACPLFSPWFRAFIYSVDKMKGKHEQPHVYLIWQPVKVQVIDSKREAENHLCIIHIRNLKGNHSEFKCNMRNTWGCNLSLCDHTVILKEMLSFWLFTLVSMARKGKRRAINVSKPAAFRGAGMFSNSQNLVWADRP